jgi:tartrate dehydrogenase/decarboxylase/D-malate dehydrogenase
MFEPVHGSAPDIAGKGSANPIASIWAGSMMLRHLGAIEAAEAIMSAIGTVVASGIVRTPDQGGTSSTIEVARAVSSAMRGR